MNDITEVTLSQPKKCNFCDAEARYDGKTQVGPWAYMCQKHFDKYGTGLGTGIGQRLIVRRQK